MTNVNCGFLNSELHYDVVRQSLCKQMVVEECCQTVCQLLRGPHREADIRTQIKQHIEYYYDD
eukprot:2541478-Amphidinium_carterae.1